MAKYLLACGCGKQVPVEVGQAGGRVGCSCGAQIEVPPLRKLRHMPLEKAEEKDLAAGWGLRQGVIAASVISAAVMVAFNAWSWWTQPTVPRYDPVAHERSVDENLKKLTPAGAWLAWVEYYRPLAERGFLVFEPSNKAEVEREIAHRQFLRRTLWIAVAIFAAIAAAAAFWPAPAKTRRPGDKETRRAD